MLVIAVLSVSAHEYWFEPDSFFLDRGQKTALHLYVGEALIKDEERVFQSSKTVSIQLFGPTGVHDLRSLANEDSSPIMNFASDKSGTYLFSLERNWSYITLEAAKFEDYLREDGMEYVIADRRKRGESQKDGHERYARFIKTLLQIGDSHTALIKERVNTRLEIVPLDNPYTKKIGQTMAVQIWFKGRPLAGSTIFADSRDGDKVETQKLTTDKDGKAIVKLNRKGIWLVRLVTMQRCEKNCEGADWESFWGALSFGVK